MGRKAKRARVLARRARLLGSPEVAPEPAPVADANDNGVTSKAELNRLTKVQLLEMADRESLSVKRSGKKAEVVNEIWAQLRA